MLLQDILTRLDKLHFPPEWQSLFAQAGVPSAALDDPMTSRSLIDIVTRTLDGRMPRPSDVPALLLDSARDEHRNDVIELTVEDMEGRKTLKFPFWYWMSFDTSIIWIHDK